MHDETVFSSMTETDVWTIVLRELKVKHQKRFPVQSDQIPTASALAAAMKTCYKEM
jgi:hypothetical protein